MKVFEETGIYGKGHRYVIETVEDFDEWRDLHKDSYGTNRFADEMIGDFRQCIGKNWKDPKTGTLYKVIGLEDNEAYMDWYWIIQNVDDERDMQYPLANDSDFYNQIVN